MIRAARTSFSLEKVNKRHCIDCAHGTSHCVPSLADVDDINAIRTGLPDVGLHMHLEVLGSQVTLSCKHHLNVLGRGVEDRGQLRRSHGERLLSGAA